MKQSTLLTFFLLLWCASAFAADNQADENAYCKYVTEQGIAERDLLRSPSVIAGPTQPSAGTPPQLIVGVTGSLANEVRAPLTGKAARAACALYVAETEAQQHIHYAIPKMERDALLHRLNLVQQASDQLQQMINTEEKMVEAKNATRQGLYYLQSARARLDMRRTAALTGILPFIPAMSDVPIRELVGSKLQADEAHQRAVAKLAKESGWDLELVAGGRHQIGNSNSATNISKAGGFGEVSLTYNFARHAANNHLENSTSEYLDFKSNQLNDVEQQAAVLKKQIEETVSFLRPQLEALMQHDSDIEESLRSIEGLDTANALTFKNQLLADRIVLRVDLGDIQFRVDWLQSYLHDNF